MKKITSRKFGVKFRDQIQAQDRKEKTKTKHNNNITWKNEMILHDYNKFGYTHIHTHTEKKTQQQPPWMVYNA